MFVYLPHRSQEALGEHLRLIELLEDGGKDEVEAYARWYKLRTVEACRAMHARHRGARHRGARHHRARHHRARHHGARDRRQGASRTPVSAGYNDSDSAADGRIDTSEGAR